MQSMLEVFAALTMGICNWLFLMPSSISMKHRERRSRLITVSSLMQLLIGITAQLGSDVAADIDARGDNDVRDDRTAPGGDNSGGETEILPSSDNDSDSRAVTVDTEIVPSAGGSRSDVQGIFVVIHKTSFFTFFSPVLICVFLPIFL